MSPGSANERPHVLVTGATGYIGSNVLGPLADAGFTVRAGARTPARVRAPQGVEVVAADAFDARAVRASLEGVDVAYYLVHTLGGGAEYRERDRVAANVFAEAARDAGVRRIVYLGGLGEDTGSLSEHLASRQEVGRLLAATGIEVVEFRASIVIGAGSTSWEMIRNLTEKLPVMTTPRWVRQDAQPIAIADVVAYLVAAATLPRSGEGHRIYEIGGADIVSYGGLLRLYAGHRGLRRLVIPVPVLSPGLSGWWLYLFTPKEATVGRQLAESLRFPTVVGDDRARRDFPEIVPAGVDDAMDAAFAADTRAIDATSWLAEFGDDPTPRHEQRHGRHIDSRSISVTCPPEAAFDPVACIGGERGWYAFDTLWDIRGFVDILLGGPGHRRGRRDPYALVEGDHLEWWRVERVEAPRLLRLKAEMKMPGQGWLVYELATRADGEGTTVRQTAIYDAKGVMGRAYWYLVLPFHHFVFNGTLAGIERECLALIEGPDTCPLPGTWQREVDKRGEQEA